MAEAISKEMSDDDDGVIVFYDWIEPLEDWLENNSPLKTTREIEVTWLMILPKNVETVQEESKKHNSVKLKKDWEALKASGKPLNFPNIREVGVKCGLRYGMWITHMETGVKVQTVWNDVARQFVDGALTHVANEVRISPLDPAKPNDIHALIFYNDDCTDEGKIYALENAIRRSGVETDLKYKPGVFNHLNIYVGNQHNVGPSAYLSHYDAVDQSSTITRLWENTTQT